MAGDDAIRREDLIESRDLPTGKTCALCGGGPGSGGGADASDTRTPGREPMTYYKGQMVPRREVERIRAEEAAAATMPPPRGPAPTPEQFDGGDAGADPVETMQVEHVPEPAPVTPPRIRSSVPPTPIGIEGIALDIASDRGIWYVGIYRDGEKIADDASRSNPLITKGTAKRIADRVKKEFSHLDRKAVQGAVDRFFEVVREADEAITADAVCRVISSIVRVEKETSDPPVYVVHLSDGKSMVFSTRDLAALQPVTLNERWLAVRDDPLDATGRDFKEIRDHIMAVAVPMDPPGPASPWERTISKLETRIAPLPLEQDRSGLKRHGICLEPNGVLLIRSDLIQDVIVESGQNPNDGGFARYLKKMGILLVESKPYRIPGVKTLVRAWGVTPDIKDDPTGGLEGSLAGDPVGD